MKHISLMLLSAPLLLTMSIIAGCGDDDTSPVDASVDNNNIVDTSTPDSATIPDTGGSDADAKVDATLQGGQVDRAGRSAIIEALVSAANKESYNLSDKFGSTLQSDFQRHLVALDLVDTVDNWDGGSLDGSTVDAGDASVTTYPHPLVSVLGTDVLIVNTNRPFCTDGYLGIEYQVLRKGMALSATTSCGGRWLADDAVDKTLSMFVKAELTGVSDNVSQATKAPTLAFPYVSPP